MSSAGMYADLSNGGHGGGYRPNPFDERLQQPAEERDMEAQGRVLIPKLNQDTVILFIDQPDISRQGMTTTQVMQQETDEDHKDFLERVETEAKRMARIGDVTAFSPVIRYSMPIERTELS